MAGFVKETYNGEEVQRRAPVEKWKMLVSLFGEENLRGENVMVQTRGQQSMFGDGPAAYAFVPATFRGKIMAGDIVVIQVADRGPHAGEYAVLKAVNPPNCEKKSPAGGIGSPEVYCDGARARLVLLEEQKK